AEKKFDQTDKFRQLEEILPTPNNYRTASGASGHEYWQQKVDYVIDVRIDDEKQHLYGSESISYQNNSQDILDYLWLQLDANIRQPHSEANLSRTTGDFDQMSFREYSRMLAKESFQGGLDITACTDVWSGNKLNFAIIKTMMRVDLPKPLSHGETFQFRIDWNYKINNSKLVRGRTGFERFEKDGNCIYEMAQWFPRLCAYTDVNGWQHKQFLGRGEFTLEFGNYEVNITVPRDHIVASTGVLQNVKNVLTQAQQERLVEAQSSKTPVFIVTPDEALKNETLSESETKTWKFKAENVRDFAFASSRKFIWDAMIKKQDSHNVMCMSYYPNEGEPLWSRYSTHAIAHTLEVYSRHTFDYPYPVAISVNGPVGGMEYPMICFNGPRPEEDGTYSKRTKYGLISVIIHEVGHNYFPMIVNSDERQWTWMDEGLNTFLQFLTEQEWEEDYPSRRGEPKNIVPYMASLNQVPIMTNSESLLQFGSNAYAKPATALNILRETILGRELFDFAFKQYANRWKFKRPMPSDFFRSMEDASGIDLDWFWRGWFYSTEHVDIKLAGVKQLNVDTLNPEIEKSIQREDRDGQPVTLSQERNKGLDKYIDSYKGLDDFYNEFDPLDVTDRDIEKYEKELERLENDEKKHLSDSRNFYLVSFENVGGLVMPVILQLTFADGTEKVVRYPAEVWNKNNKQIQKLIISDKEIVKLVIDPRLETADTDISNNQFPPVIRKSRFKLFKERERLNDMQKAQGKREPRGEGEDRQ
ncbi:MAG: M1 family metallopeptidase, partial [Planctomycetota bacterium]